MMWETEMFGVKGVIETPPNVTEDEFNEKFLQFIGEQGWTFSGGTWRYENVDEEDC